MDFNPDQNPFEAILAAQKNGPTSGGPTDPATMYAQMGQGAAGAQGPQAAAMQGATPPQGGPGMPPGMPPQAMAAMAGMMGQGGMGDMPQPSTAPGGNPGVSKHLLVAMGAMQKLITESTDIREIQIARMIVKLMNKLVEGDQEKQTQAEQAGPQEAPTPDMGMGGMPAGAPGGM